MKILAFVLLISTSLFAGEFQRIANKIYSQCGDLLDNFNISQICKTPSKNIYLVYGGGGGGSNQYPGVKMAAMYLKPMSNGCSVSETIRLGWDHKKDILVARDNKDEWLSLPYEGGRGFHRKGNQEIILNCSIMDSNSF